MPTQMASSAESPFSSGSARRRLMFAPKIYEGESFYFDLDGYNKTAQLEADITRLGGRIERFLSREVNFVITNKTFGSSTESTKTPSPSSDGQKTPVMSRGMALVLKSTSARRSSVGRNDVLTNAKMWGVPILPLQEVLKKVKSGDKKVSKGGSKNIENSFKPLDENEYTYFKGNCIKIDDSSAGYRPVYCSFTDFPHIDIENGVFFGKNEDAEKVTSKAPEPTVPSNKSTCHTPGGIATPRRALAVKQAVSVSKMRGYCECCDVWYRCLDDHLVSLVHRRFADNNNNFDSLDNVIDSFPSFDELISSCLDSESKNELKDEEETNKSKLVCNEDKQTFRNDSSHKVTECVLEEVDKHVNPGPPSPTVHNHVSESANCDNIEIPENQITTAPAEGSGDSVITNSVILNGLQMTQENNDNHPTCNGILTVNADIQETIDISLSLNKPELDAFCNKNQQECFFENDAKSREEPVVENILDLSPYRDLVQLSDSSLDQLPSAHITSPSEQNDPYEFCSESDEFDSWKITRRASTKLIIKKNGPTINETTWNEVYQSPPLGCSFVDIEDDVFNDSITDRGADSVPVALSSDSSASCKSNDSASETQSSDQSSSDEDSLLEVVDELRESMFSAKRHSRFPDSNNFQWSVKNEENSGQLKLKLCKIVVTPISQPYDLDKVKWRVTRSGNCKLIFKSDTCKKRVSQSNTRRSSIRSRQLKFNTFEGMD